MLFSPSALPPAEQRRRCGGSVRRSTPRPRRASRRTRSRDSRSGPGHRHAHHAGRMRGELFLGAVDVDLRSRGPQGLASSALALSSVSSSAGPVRSGPWPARRPAGASSRRRRVGPPGVTTGRRPWTVPSNAARRR
jgi:hypothetical protein